MVRLFDDEVNSESELDFSPNEREVDIVDASKETVESVVYHRLRGFVVAVICIALGFFIGRESVRSNWLKSNLVKPTPKVIIITPDHVDPPPSGNPFNLRRHSDLPPLP